MKKIKNYLAIVLTLMLIVIMPFDTFAATKSMSVTASCGSVYVGANKKVSVKAPKGAKISYKTLNSYASVDSKGNVKGKKAGTGKVRVTVSKKGYKTVTKTVTVKVVKRNQKINAKNVTVAVGKSASLGASAKTGLKFKTSNSKIATVNSKGVVVGKKAGTVKITVYTNGNGTYNKASRTVTVKVTKPAHKHSYKKVVTPAKTHKVEHKEEGHWVEPKWVVDTPAHQEVVSDAHDAYVCSKCGLEMFSIEEADAHIAEENASHILVSKVNKVIHHDAVEEVSHQEMVVPETSWLVCDGYEYSGCGFATTDDNEMIAHRTEFVNKNMELMDKYMDEGYSQDEALAKADAECPIHDVSHVETRPAVYQTVIDTPAQEAWDEVLEDEFTYTCGCGETFDSEEDFNRHVEESSATYELKHIDAVLKDVPEEGHYEGERTWVVDKKAYTETVVDVPEKVVYKCSCGAIKK